MITRNRCSGGVQRAKPVAHARSATMIRVVLTLLVCLTACGCTRKYWRKQADDLSYDLIRTNQDDPRWFVDRVAVETDPRSRFYEAYDPDWGPLPPDDVGAHKYMHWAYGRSGYKHWHDFGDLATVENPHWLEPFGMPQDVVESNMGRPALLPDITLTLEDAIDISYIHSRDYQTQIENVYSTALQLTAQRFAFDVQFIGLNGRRPSSDVLATDIPSTSDSVNWNPNVGAQQLLPTGAQWLVNLANNTLWLFAGGKASDATASTLSYSILQPLLANGGRRFVMENLTQAERNLLYAVRDLARYRMGFFTSTVAGGFTAGIATGQPGVFLGGPTIPTPIANFPGASQGGFLGLLQLNQIVVNTEYNIRQLREQLERLKAQAAERPDEISEPLAALPQGFVIPPELAGRIRYNAQEHQLSLRGQLNEIEVRTIQTLSNDPAFQRALADLIDRSNILTTNQNIVQLETQLATTVTTLRTSRANYLNGLDGYKLQLGLPIDMPVTIDRSMLKPFELVDPLLIRIQDRLNAFVAEPPDAYQEHPDAAPMLRVAELMKRLDPAEPDQEVLRGLVAEMLVIRDDLKRDGVDATENDFRRVEEQRRQNIQPPPPDDQKPMRRDPKRDERLKQILVAEFREADAKLLKLQKDLAKPGADLEDRQKVLDTLIDLREDFLKISQNFSVIQIDLRVDLIDLAPWSMSMEDAVATGLGNRLDLMNARATVMDLRRKVEVQANQLQATMNVVAQGNIQTQPLVSGNGNPFDFRGKDSSFQVGLQFTTPIQLVAQRNAYRASLIAYLQARRNYMRTEDQVKLDIRTNWRILDYNRRNFETIRDQIRAATAQLDIAAEQTAAPAGVAAAGAAAGGGGAGGGGGGGQAQGLQIIQAVSSVLNAQNSLISTWINFEATRLDIYNFMGTLEIDREGYWTDEFYQARTRIHRANPTRLYPPLDQLQDYNPPAELAELNDVSPARDGGSAAAPPVIPPRKVGTRPGHVRLVNGESGDRVEESKKSKSRKGP